MENTGSWGVKNTGSVENTGSSFFLHKKRNYATHVNFCLIYLGVGCDGCVCVPPPYE